MLKLTFLAIFGLKRLLLGYFVQIRAVTAGVPISPLVLASKTCSVNLSHPAYYARAVSNVVGMRVLHGNWSGDYEGGKMPNYRGKFRILVFQRFGRVLVTLDTRSKFLFVLGK